MNRLPPINRIRNNSTFKNLVALSIIEGEQSILVYYNNMEVISMYTRNHYADKHGIKPVKMGYPISSLPTKLLSLVFYIKGDYFTRFGALIPDTVLDL